ncbi:MAG: metallophosphoesterase [Lentisphaeria bacterium]|nr:metallophosphoesterase [Lentisphaeria bacterium]
MKKFSLFVLTGLLCLAAAAEEPLMKAGLLSDTHVTPDPQSCLPLEKACELFRKHRVDLLVNAGDVADTPQEQAYVNYRKTIRKVFPEKKPPEMMSLAYHDAIGYGNYHTIYPNAWSDFKRRLELAHEMYDLRKIKGYNFLVFPQGVDYARFEKMIADACKDTPDKPVFLVDHYPAWNTVFNSQTWGDANRRRILDKYPQVIQLCGHVHAENRRENSIWQGNFTVVNIPHSRKSQWGHFNADATIMEIYKNKVVFRRFDAMTGKEYSPDERWTVLLPHDPASALYTAQKRKLIPAPQFDRGTEITVTPDRDPAGTLVFSFNEAQGKYNTFFYRMTLFRKTAEGPWEFFGNQDKESHAFTLLPDKGKTSTLKLSSGYFESGKEYKVRITPFDFFNNSGQYIEKCFTAPPLKKTTLLFSSCDPMKDCPFKKGREGSGTFKIQNGYYLYSGSASRLTFPRQAWDVPAGQRLRLTLDMRMIQKHIHRPWTISIRDAASRKVVVKRIYTPGGSSGLQRYVIEFPKRKADDHYEVYFRDGKPGRLRIEYVKTEKI